MNHKFTADGRKVVVVGALNAKETIVQEVFVTDGTEFPAGEHFVVKTLLDAPAETYKAKREREAEENIKTLEKQKELLSAQIADLQFKRASATAKVKWIEGITETEVREAFDNIKAMLSGEYTHVVIKDHSSFEIKEWDEKLFTSTDDYYRTRFESLRLISLFGDWNGRLNLNWKVNTYRDGSGSSTNFYPCRSLQEAIEKVKEVVDAKDYLSDVDYQLCLKYGIPVDEAKNTDRIQKKADYIKKQIAERQDQIRKMEADLSAIR